MNVDALMQSGFGFALVLFRTTCFVSLAPFWGEAQIPARLRLGVAVGISAPLFFGAGSPHLAMPASMGALIACGAWEAALGLLGALGARLVLATAQGAGHVAGLSLGLGFANLVTPDGQQSPVVGQLLWAMTLGVAMALGVHREAVAWIARSLVVFPVGAPADLTTLLNRAIGYGLFSIALAVRIAFPVLAASVIGHVALGLANRASPAVNISSLGFSASILAGGIALYMAAPGAASLAAQATLGAVSGP